MNVLTKLDDGQAGWPEHGPFDRILFSASAARVPVEMIEQLEEGGIMVFPLQRGAEQVITRITKRSGGVLYGEPGAV